VLYAINSTYRKSQECAEVLVEQGVEGAAATSASAPVALGTSGENEQLRQEERIGRNLRLRLKECPVAWSFRQVHCHIPVRLLHHHSHVGFLLDDPIPTLSQSCLLYTYLTLSVVYISTTFFEIDKLESVLSSRFRSADAHHGLEEGFVLTLATTTATTLSSSS
jgi:hypothetical protein